MLEADALLYTNKQTRPDSAGLGNAAPIHVVLFFSFATGIQATHKEPEEAVDHVALNGVRVLRWSFDVLAGFKTGVIDEHKCES